MTAPSLSRRLARGIRTRTAHPDDLDRAERYVRDWLGCWAAGGTTPPGRALRAHAAGEDALDERLFVAAALSHITETDDLHRGSVTHPGCVVVPTALVLGHALQVSGARVLHAVLAGYEAMLRVGEALGPAHYRLFHNTATAGVFGSAAAAATLLDLDEDAWVWAFGNAGTQAAGLWQFNEDATMSKHLHAGHAASAGARAARLAHQGFTGPDCILEGERGFFRALCPDADPEAILRPASGWKLPETSLKPYPCCRHTHPAIDAALMLRPRLEAAGTLSGSLRSLRISTYGAGRDVTDAPAPTTTYAAKFSMQFCVASALLRGSPGLSSFEGSALEDPTVRAAMAVAGVDEDPGLEAAYPARWGAVVEVVDGAGRTWVERCDAARGDPEAPLDDAALDDKVRGLFRYGGWSEEAAETLCTASRALRTGPSFALR
ncbi:MAG: MmgE/PrpD family protein [Gemmatimonadota bacterium]|nr:MmgE/PrpD family protein [Gemmatimonadota bacterium]